MTLALAPLAGPIQPVASVETTIFTATTKTLLKEILVTNLGSADTVFNVSIVRSGNTAGTSNRIARSMPIAGHDTIPMGPMFQVLNVGDFISVLVGAAVTVVFTASGVLDVP